MSPTQRTARASKLKLAAILAVLLLTPALALLALDDWDGLRQQGGRLLAHYLLGIFAPTFFTAILLFRLAFRPASPARRTMDYLLGVLCVADSTLVLLTATHPYNDVIAGQFLTLTVLMVALSLEDLYQPVYVPPPRVVASRSRLPRWLRRSFAVLFVVAPLPLAIWLCATANGLDPHMPQFVMLSLLASMDVGMRWNERVLAQPSRKAPAGANLATQVAEPPESAIAALGVASLQDLTDADVATDKRGVLVSRSCAIRFLGMPGDLWIFPGGLLRIPLGWLKVLRCVGIFYNARRLTVRVFDVGDFLHATTDPRNLWIPRIDIADAELRRGVIYGELRVTINDGRTWHLLWEPSAATRLLLSETLKEWLGERVEAPETMVPPG